MAVSKFIQAVKDEARGRPRSTQWYRDKIKEFGKPGAMDLLRDGKRNNKPFYGKLNMFFYDRDSTPQNVNVEVAGATAGTSSGAQSGPARISSVQSV